MEFIPWDSVRAILNVLEVGAKKYAPRNWEQGMHGHAMRREERIRSGQSVVKITPQKDGAGNAL
jgi:hypothetical protein